MIFLSNRKKLVSLFALYLLFSMVGGVLYVWTVNADLFGTNIYGLILASIISFLIPVLIVQSIGNDVSLKKSLLISWKLDIKIILYSILLFGACVPLLNGLHILNHNLLTLLPESATMKLQELSISYAKEILNTFLPLDKTSFFDILLFFIGLALVPAVTEELFFRSGVQQLLINSLKKEYFAILIAGFIFSLLHFEPSGFLVRWVLGILLGYLIFITQNVLLGMMIHFLNNGIQILSLWTTPEEELHSVILAPPEWITEHLYLEMVLWIVSALLSIYFMRKILARVSTLSN